MLQPRTQFDLVKFQLGRNVAKFANRNELESKVGSGATHYDCYRFGYYSVRSPEDQLLLLQRLYEVVRSDNGMRRFEEPLSPFLFMSEIVDARKDRFFLDVEKMEPPLEGIRQTQDDRIAFTMEKMPQMMDHLCKRMDEYFIPKKPDLKDIHFSYVVLFPRDPLGRLHVGRFHVVFPFLFMPLEMMSKFAHLAFADSEFHSYVDYSVYNKGSVC